MYQIDVESSAQSLPAPTAEGSPGFFTDGNPATATPATIVPAEILNSWMLELLNVLDAANILPSKSTYNQLALAIKKMIGESVVSYSVDSGVANAYVIALDPPVTEYHDGLPFQFRSSHTNTAASTLTAGGDVLPLVRNDGSAVHPGDISVGSIISGNYIATTNSFQISNVVKSQVTDITDAALANKVTGSSDINIVYTQQADATNFPYVIIGDANANLRPLLLSRLQWMLFPVGVMTPIMYEGSAPYPAKDDPDFRWIILSAGNSYNSGVLVDEQIVGTGPLLRASGVINHSRSPLNGRRIQLINTSRMVIRPGGPGIEQTDTLQNITGFIQSVIMRDTNSSTSGALSLANQGATGLGSAGGMFAGITFDASQSSGARTSDETRMNNIGQDFWMRIV